VNIYPLFETALRGRLGLTPDEHLRRVAELWARFSAVAATNPHAAIRRAWTAEEIAQAGTSNRFISYPYRKVMNSNNDVDQAAAVVLCSVERATASGIPRERWVFLHGAASAQETPYLSNRFDLSRCAPIAAAGAAALSTAGLGVDDIAHVDLYSCFPSAVQIGAAELGLGLDEPDRPLTVTGGLSFAGGPGNNYVSHSIAAMVDVLRADPGSFGLCTALGWYITKHAVGVYSTEPPPNGFRHDRPQDQVDVLPRRDPVGDYEGAATIDSYTVMHERDGEPAIGLVACLLPDGRRTWANTNEPGLMKAMTLEEFVGRTAALKEGGQVEVS